MGLSYMSAFSHEAKAQFGPTIPVVQQTRSYSNTAEIGRHFSKICCVLKCQGVKSVDGETGPTLRFVCVLWET